jgi:hypothetical protein
MLGTGVLNVVIGLVFIFLLYSLLATIVQEFISTWMALRAGMLRKGIMRMLEDHDEEIAGNLTDAFYHHPLVKYLAEKNKKSRPSYLSARNFSKVLIDLLQGKHNIPGEDMRKIIQKALDSGEIQWETAKIGEETLQYLRSMWVDARGDIEKFRVLIEQWFDDTMERTAGWYKKKVQYILFFIGLTIAILFNVETISIVQKLSKNPELAEQLVNQAEKYTENQVAAGNLLQSARNDSLITGKNSPAEEDTLMLMIRKSNQLLDSARMLVSTDIKDVSYLLGLGWSGKSPENQYEISICDNFRWYSVFGWLITALAISLGAPFWFDLLNRLMKLRNSVSIGTSAKETGNAPGAASAESTTVNRVG